MVETIAMAAGGDRQPADRPALAVEARESAIKVSRLLRSLQYSVQTHFPVRFYGKEESAASGWYESRRKHFRFPGSVRYCPPRQQSDARRNREFRRHAR